jgi:hypothetical protein
MGPKWPNLLLERVASVEIEQRVMDDAALSGGGTDATVG